MPLLPAPPRAAPVPPLSVGAVTLTVLAPRRLPLVAMSLGRSSNPPSGLFFADADGGAGAGGALEASGEFGAGAVSAVRDVAGAESHFCGFREGRVFLLKIKKLRASKLHFFL